MLNYIISDSGNMPHSIPLNPLVSHLKSIISIITQCLVCHAALLKRNFSCKKKCKHMLNIQSFLYLLFCLLTALNLVMACRNSWDFIRSTAIAHASLRVKASQQS